MTLETDNSTVTSGGARGYLPYIYAALAVSLLFLGWMLFARNSASRIVTASAPSATATRDAETVAYYGNGQLKVLSFYANPAEVRPGARALVCYGVSNAESVTIDPPVGNVWPSASRCLEVTAKKDTEYKLTARDAGGHEKSQTAVLHVVR